MNEKEVISPQEIMMPYADDGGEISLQQLPPVMKAKMSLAWMVGGMMALVIVAVTIQGMFGDVDKAVKMFDLIVARTLVPIFMAILGYIFGTQSKQTVSETS